MENLNGEFLRGIISIYNSKNLKNQKPRPQFSFVEILWNGKLSFFQFNFDFFNFSSNTFLNEVRVLHARGSWLL